MTPRPGKKAREILHQLSRGFLLTRVASGWHCTSEPDNAPPIATGRTINAMVRHGWLVSMLDTDTGGELLVDELHRNPWSTPLVISPYGRAAIGAVTP